MSSKRRAAARGWFDRRAARERPLDTKRDHGRPFSRDQRRWIYASSQNRWPHPSLVTMDHIEILDDQLRARPAATIFDYGPGWGCPSPAQQRAIRAIMEGREDEEVEPIAPAA